MVAMTSVGTAAGATWQSDITGTGTDKAKIQSDGAAFSAQLKMQAATDEAAGDTTDANKLNAEASVVDNADQSLNDSSYDQQSTESAWNTAASGGTVNSDATNLSTINSQNSSTISSPGNDTTSEQKNLKAFIQEETADGHTATAAAAQQELTDLQDNNTGALSTDQANLNSAAVSDGVTTSSLSGALANMQNLVNQMGPAATASTSAEPTGAAVDVTGSNAGSSTLSGDLSELQALSQERSQLQTKLTEDSHTDGNSAAYSQDIQELGQIGYQIMNVTADIQQHETENSTGG